MASCAICGKDIGIFDSSTSYVNERGSRVEVHTSCKQAHEGGAFSTGDPTYYVPTDEGAGGAGTSTGTSSPLVLGLPRKTWYVIGGVAALVVGVGVIVGIMRG